MLIAYDAAGDVIATLDRVVVYGPAGEAIGLVDFAAHEAAGGKLRDVWNVVGNGVPASGSGTWPEFLGARAHDFRVERADGRIVALVHKASGHRRTRADAEKAVREIVGRDLDPGQPPDRAHNTARALRDRLGSPSRPLELDADGKAATAPERPQRPVLPLVGASGRPAGV
jgi:hypothetical protein